MKLPDIIKEIKEYDFQEIHKRAHQRMVNRRRPINEITESTGDFNEYLQSLNEGLTDAVLRKGELYYVFDISGSPSDKQISLITTSTPLKFIGFQGSRLIFCHPTNVLSARVFFPDENHVAADQIRKVYIDQSKLNENVTIFLLKFSQSDWIIDWHAYEANGDDIMFVQKLAK